METRIIIHIKCLRTNFFTIVSDNVGKVLFSKSSGMLNLKNTQKRTKDAFNDLLMSVIQFVLTLGTKIKIFVKLEGTTKNLFLKKVGIEFLNTLKRHNIFFCGLHLKNKISYNGCRKSIHRK
jgi:ribosomal protein S11